MAGGKRRPRAIAPSRGIAIEIVGLPEVEAMLAEWEPAKVAVRTRLATRAGAKVLRGPLKSAAGALSKRMGASVYIHQAKGDRAATVVGHHRKKAFFWHMVIGGTKAHSLRPRKASKILAGGLTRTYPTVRGVPPHPIVAAVVASHGEQAQRAMIAELTKE